MVITTPWAIMKVITTPWAIMRDYDGNNHPMGYYEGL